MQILETIEQKADRFEREMGCIKTEDSDYTTFFFQGDMTYLVGAAVYAMQFSDSHYDSGGHVSAASSLDEIAIGWLARSDTASDILSEVYARSYNDYGSTPYLISNRNSDWMLWPSNVLQHCMILVVDKFSRWALELKIPTETIRVHDYYDDDI